MITHHTQLLQALIDKYGLKSYLEIGVQNPANNFDKVRCDLCCGIDPDFKADQHYKIGSYFKNLYSITSDEYFEQSVNLLMQVDLIFIDGDHTKEQVKKDFENSLRCLSDNGFIVIHDVLPENEAGTIVPRQTKVWWGDVYKWAMQIHCTYNGVNFKTFNIDNGCLLIWRDETKKIQPPQFVVRNELNWWQHYKEVGKVLLNVTDEVII